MSVTVGRINENEIGTITNEEMEEIISNEKRFFKIQEISDNRSGVKKTYKASCSLGEFKITLHNDMKLFLENIDYSNFLNTCVIINQKHKRRILRRIKNRQFVN